MWLRALVLSTFVAIFVIVASPACVVLLSDRNSPLPNGGVTGPNADCSTVKPLSAGGPGTGAPATKHIGRFDPTDPNKLHFDWSGNTMTARFQGTSVTWGATADQEIVFEMVIDGVDEQVILGGLAAKTVTRTVPDGTHEITVVRSSEALFGACDFVPFTFGPGTTQLPATDHPRRIEYIGDSITCGYGDEGANATCPYDIPIRQETDPDSGKTDDVTLPKTQNIYAAYGSIAARKLSADAVTLCFSGKGVVLNYTEKGAGEGAINQNDKPGPDAKTTIPQYYLRTIASDPTSAPWDFSKEPQPQAVVLNIGTNDFARDVDQNSVADGIDLVAFRAGYLAFVKFVRSKRPDAHIFLALPPMVTDVFPLTNARTDFRNTLNSIVEELNGAGDQKVYFIELVEMGVRYGLGCDYHPNLVVHQIMGDQVAGAIHLKTCW